MRDREACSSPASCAARTVTAACPARSWSRVEVHSRQTSTRRHVQNEVADDLAAMDQGDTDRPGAPRIPDHRLVPPPTPLDLERMSHRGGYGLDDMEWICRLQARAEPSQSGRRIDAASQVDPLLDPNALTTGRGLDRHRDHGDGKQATGRAVAEESFSSKQENGIKLAHGHEEPSVRQGPTQHQLDVKEPMPQDRDPDRGRKRYPYRARGRRLPPLRRRQAQSVRPRRG